MTPSRYSDPDVQVAAEALRRLRDPKVGADTRAPGKYAVYFYDEDGEQIRSVGGFDSPGEAARGVYLIWAETVLEEVGAAHAESGTGYAEDPLGGAW